MEIIETPIKDLLIIKPKIFKDSRGFFCETYNQERYQEAGINSIFVQDNQSESVYGVIRGLHFQHTPHSQAKLVTVLIGTVWDVAVDLRSGSPTYGQWYGVELSSENLLQYYIPQGFAHGFSVLSPKALFSYKCDNFYAPHADGGIRYNDPTIGIDWKIPTEQAIVSEKDQNLPFFNQVTLDF